MLVMLKKMIKDEKFPKSFDKTLLIQIHKSGSSQDLANSRFIHMKEALAKITESLVVKGMKEDILEASSKFQIGGQPGHTLTEHVFTILSIMIKAEKDEEGIIFTAAYIIKFFDKRRYL